MENRLLEFALHYAGLGLFIFPLIPCTKKPLTPNGFYDASHDLSYIKEWWAKTPDANIGIRTGKINGFFVVDIDGPCPEEFLKFLPPMIKVKSFKGFHYYFRYPENQTIENRIRVNGWPIDIKSDNGYIVAPPSIHPEGGIYEFIC